MAPPPRWRLIGYTRVSTGDQTTDAQLIELKAAGCMTIHQEHGSGTSRTRPVLVRFLREIKPGEVLVVVRPDCLARSVSHLLEAIETLEAKRRMSGPCMTRSPPPRFKAFPLADPGRYGAARALPHLRAHPGRYQGRKA